VGAGVCVPNPCTEPPDPTCDGDQLVAFEPLGACALVGDPFEAECSYTSQSFDCSPYGGCADGACLEAPSAPAQFGDLVITELLRHSAGPAPDRGEWLELFNPGASDVDLRGCHMGAVQDTIAGLFPVVVPAGGYVLITGDGDPQMNGGLEPTAIIPSLDLGNVTDYIGLTCASGVIDDLAYTLGWSGSQGVSMQLDADYVVGTVPAIVNNFVQFWCDATMPYGTSENVGTPGAPNEPCPEAPE